ncbi:MAG: M48 family metallopeptidase [Treponema sp.]|nr:M48 family metallopeptidase [Treponema sp.]
MVYSNPFVILYLVGLFASFSINLWLEYIDYKHRVKHGTEVPVELAHCIDVPTLQKTCAYENAKYYAWLPMSVVTTICGVLLFVLGYYPFIYSRIATISVSIYVKAILFFILAGIPSTIVALPFELYQEFKIEKQFGFSTMTVRMWIIDQIKGIVVSAVLLIPLLCIMIALLESTPLWWLLLSVVYVLFSLGISVLYPLVLAPLFNKFTPLEEGALKDRLTALLSKVGFKAEGVYVMDASKRSKHSNAYFTGFGKSKRIVLYDTLIQQLSVDEIEAVLGHELGHYKCHHIIKRLVVMIPLIFVSLFILSKLVGIASVYEGFGFGNVAADFTHMHYIGIFLLSTVFSGYGVWTELISNYFSRKDEFEADAYAAKVCGSGQPLATGLIALNKENLSELVPPKVYSLFNYNHPPLLERIRAVGYVPSEKK